MGFCLQASLNLIPETLLMRIPRSVLFIVALASVLLRSSASIDAAGAQHPEHPAGSGAALVAAVRQATEAFRDVSNLPPGYGPALGCVSGPAEGAMGAHFVNPGLLFDAALDPAQPEALIYESKNGFTRLVGVEFILFADVWHESHALNDPPLIEGQLLQFVDGPNRFGLPAHYELHVWAWRDNPNGVFADWNTHVSCEGQ